MEPRRRIAEGYEGHSRTRLWAEGLVQEGAARLRAAGHKRPACRFVIFAQGRTGSTLLTSSLDSHPQIRCADEILRRPVLDALSFVENRAAAAARPAFGFHVKCYQLTRLQRIDDWAAFLTALSERDWKIVYLRRENVVKHVFSGMFAQQTGRFHVRGGERPEQERIMVDIAELRAWLSQRDNLCQDEKAALGTLPRFDLVYERDLADPARRERALASLQDYLGLAPAPLTSPLRKSVSRPLHDMIANFGQVEAALAGTPYEAQLRAA